MTNEEHIAELKEARRIMKNYGAVCMSVETIDKCIEALEKQIPKKPELDVSDGEYSIFLCPTCKRIFCIDEPQICDKCGQAIDWSDDND